MKKNFAEIENKALLKTNMCYNCAKNEGLNVKKEDFNKLISECYFCKESKQVLTLKDIIEIHIRNGEKWKGR